MLIKPLQGLQRSRSINDSAIQHMQEKYGESFSCLAPWGSSMTGNREFLATCAALPGKAILVQVLDYKGNTPVYKDNYVAFYHEKETVSYFLKAAVSVFGEAIIHYQPNELCVSSTLSKDTSFEAFYADESTYIVIYIEIKGSSYISRAQFEAFFSRLHNSRGQISVRIIAVDDQLYGTLDVDAINRLPSKGEDVASIIGKTENGNFQYRSAEGR